MNLEPYTQNCEPLHSKFWIPTPKPQTSNPYILRSWRRLSSKRCGGGRCAWCSSCAWWTLNP